MFSGWHDISQRPKHQHRGVVPTAQIEWELYELIKIYDRLQPAHVLEIGSQWGGTLWHWYDNLEEGSIIVNIDILQGMDAEQSEKVLRDWACWAPFGVVQHTLIGRSDDPAIHAAALNYLDGTIDFLFIDACHTYEGAKADFLRYGPAVRKGGIIALHDLVTPEYSPHIQVWQLWREIQAAGYVTQELRAGGDYGGIGVVYV